MDGEQFAASQQALRSVARTISFDARYHGRTWSPEEAFTLEDMVDDLMGLMDTLEVERAVLAGLSMGGMVALRAAVRYPERVSGLVLIGTSAKEEASLRRTHFYGLLTTSQIFWPAKPLIEEVIRHLFSKTTLQEQPALVEAQRQTLDAQRARDMWHPVRAILSRAQLEGLEEITVPTRILFGTDDLVYPAHHADDLARRISHAEVVEIPDCGHVAPLEAPAIVTEHTLDLIREVERRERIAALRERAQETGSGGA